LFSQPDSVDFLTIVVLNRADCLERFGDVAIRFTKCPMKNGPPSPPVDIGTSDSTTAEPRRKQIGCLYRWSFTQISNAANAATLM